VITLPLGPKKIRRKFGVRTDDDRLIYVLGKGDEQEIVDAWGSAVELPDTNQESGRMRALKCTGGARIFGGEYFGIVGPDGKTLVPAIHRAISCYRNGVAWAPDSAQNLWCPIGPEGVFRDQPACIDNYYPFRISHHYPEKFADEPFESNILWVRARLKWGLGEREEPPVWTGDGVMSKLSSTISSFGSP
jgi:hypothetical protein